MHAILLATLFASTLAADVAVIPERESLMQAEQSVQAVYGADVKVADGKTANAIEARKSLAERMLKTASDEKETAIRYALLQEARQQAIEAGAAVLAYQITQTLATTFGLRPADNLKPEEWIASGDKYRAEAKAATKKDALRFKLLAAESYLRAYPNAGGLRKEFIDRRIEGLCIIGLPKDRATLIGIWFVQAKDIRVRWFFRSDGTAFWKDVKGENAGKGTWSLDPAQVSIHWDGGHEDCLFRPLSPAGAIGDCWLGKNTVYARKLP